MDNTCSIELIAQAASSHVKQRRTLKASGTRLHSTDIMQAESEIEDECSGYHGAKLNRYALNGIDKRRAKGRRRVRLRHTSSTCLYDLAAKARQHHEVVYIP